MFTLGTLRNSTFYTNKGTFKADYCSETPTPLVAQIQDDKAIVFYDHFIFNSIIMEKNDDCYVLKGNKRTVFMHSQARHRRSGVSYKTDVDDTSAIEFEFNKIYTFIIDKESESERIVKPYKFNYCGVIYKFLNSYYDQARSKCGDADNDRIRIFEYCLRNYKSIKQDYFINPRKKYKRNKNDPVAVARCFENAVFPGDIYLVHFNKNELITPIGRGSIDCTRLHEDKEKFFAMLYRVDGDKYHFVDLSWYKKYRNDINDLGNNFINENLLGENVNDKILIPNLEKSYNIVNKIKINCIVNYENDKIFGLKNGKLTGILYKPMNYKIGDVVEVKIRGLREGKVIFEDYYSKNGIYHTLEKVQGYFGNTVEEVVELDLSVPFDIDVLRDSDLGETKMQPKIKDSVLREIGNTPPLQINNNPDGYSEEKEEMSLTTLNLDGYLRTMFKKDKFGAFEWVKNNRKHIYKAIPVIYEFFKENPRVWVDKLIGNGQIANRGFSKLEMEVYVEMEMMSGDKEYIRELFKRGIGMNWGVAETKEWFKKWIEWDSDKEGVKQMAIEYVKGLKK